MSGVLRHFSTTAATRLVLVAFGLATSLLTARLLGPEGRGEYFFVVTFANTIVQFANLGLHSANTYFVARDRRHATAYASNSLWMALGFGGCVGLLAAVVVWALGMYPDLSFRHLLLGAAFVPPLLFFNLGGNLLVGLGEISAFNRLQLTSAILSLVFFAVAGFWKGSAGAVLFAAVAAQTSVGVLLTFGLSKRLRGFPGAFHRDVLRGSLHYAFRAYLACLLGYVALRAPVFFLRRYASGEAMGHYSIASQMADLLIIFPQSLSLVLFPELVREAASGRWSVLTKNLRWSALIFGAVIAVACLVADPLIQLAFGARFLPAGALFRGLAPGVFCLGLTSILSQSLAAIGFPASFLWINLASLLLTLSISAAWIAGTTAVGGAVSAFTVSQAFLLVLTYLVAWRHKDTRHGDEGNATTTHEALAPG